MSPGYKKEGMIQVSASLSLGGEDWIHIVTCIKSDEGEEVISNELIVLISDVNILEVEYKSYEKCNYSLQEEVNKEYLINLPLHMTYKYE